MPLCTDANGLASATQITGPVAEAGTAGHAAVAQAAGLIEPRYHFAGGSGVFFQRSVFVPLGQGLRLGAALQEFDLGRRHQVYLAGQGVALPRCPARALAQVSEGAGPKWIHALVLKPRSQMEASELAAVTHPGRAIAQPGRVRFPTTRPAHLMLRGPISRSRLHQAASLALLLLSLGSQASQDCRGSPATPAVWR